MSEGEWQGSFKIGRDHAALAGHFPGHPVVPGVVVLAEVVSVWAGLGGEPWSELVDVRFEKPCPTARFVAVRFSGGPSGRVRFHVMADDAVVLSGLFEAGGETP